MSLLLANTSVYLTTMYKTIVVDPPWPSQRAWGGKHKRYQAEDDYPLMSLRDIAMMGISDIAEDNAHLYIWCTQSKAKKDSYTNHLVFDTQKVERMFVEYAFDLARAWGFRPMNLITWAKTGPGVGNYFQVNSEYLLFAVRGKLPGLQTGEQRPTWFEAKRGAPSEKPDEAYQLIERVSPGPRLDVFARKPREGWDVWGNEVESVHLPFLIAGRP